MDAESIDRDLPGRRARVPVRGEPCPGFDDQGALFLEIAVQRDEFAADILTHAQRLGGANEPDGSLAGALHRGWMTLKDAVGGHDDASIVREAERGERSALAAYEDSLDGMLPPGARDVIERQCAAVRHSHNRVHVRTIFIYAKRSA